MSKAAGRPRLQVGKMSAGLERERVRDQISCLFGGSQGGRLGSAIKMTSRDSIMSGDSVSVARTTNLVVTKGVSSVEAYGAGVGGAVKRHSQPVV